MSERTRKSLLVWGSIAAAVLAIAQVLGPAARACAVVIERLQTVPITAARVDILEQGQKAAEDDRRDAAERLWYIEWWVSEMGKRSGIQAPPRRRRPNP